MQVLSVLGFSDGSGVDFGLTKSNFCLGILVRRRSSDMSAHVLLAAGVAWFKEKAPPLPPSPPPPSIDVLSVLVAMLLVLLIALIFRRGGSAAAPTTASSTALPTASKAVHNYPRGPLLILWGSQTGTAEQFGNDLAREARQRGYDARSVDLEELVPEELASQIAPVVFLMSTHGEGEPTDNAIPFYTWANDTIRDAQELASLRFAVFGACRRCHRGRRCRTAPTHGPRTAHSQPLHTAPSLLRLSSLPRPTTRSAGQHAV
jgi:sulfite reductase alpha subunit-like flavoprotein